VSIEQIRALKHAKPFRPFELVTKDGQRIYIEQPIRIALSPTGDSVAGYGQDGSFFFMLSDIAAVQPRVKRRRKAT
jgi:hypothetical protein